MRLPGMDDPTDLERPRERTAAEERAAAGLLDVAAQPAARRLRTVDLDVPGRLKGIQLRATRQHRRRLAGRTAIGAAAVAAVALVAPAVLPGGGGGIVAALGLDRWSGVPAPDESSTPPDDDVPRGEAAGARDALVLTDAQVESFVGEVQGEAPGTLGTDNVRYLRDNGLDGSLSVGGWCREDFLSVQVALPQEGSDDLVEADVGPGKTWSATWRGDAPARGGIGVAVDEKVVSWDTSGLVPVWADAARAYVEATGSSPVQCDADAGRELAEGFTVLPAPLPGAVQAAAPVAGAPGSWQVRTVASGPASGTAVDMTVVLPAATAQDAGQAVLPLVSQALDRVTDWESVEKAAAEAGTDPRAGATSTAPGRVVLRPYEGAANGMLTLKRVREVLPRAARAAQPPRKDSPPGESCVGPFRAPEAYEGSSGESSDAFEAPGVDRSTTSVAQWLMYWGGTGEPTGSLLFGLDSACGPAPAGEEWESMTLSHGGADVVAAVSHPDGAPARWLVRTTAAVEPAAAVGLEIEMTASSPEEVTAIVLPLLAAAQERAYSAHFVPSAP